MRRGNGSGIRKKLVCVGCMQEIEAKAGWAELAKGEPVAIGKGVEGILRNTAD